MVDCLTSESCGLSINITIYALMTFHVLRHYNKSLAACKFVEIMIDIC